MDGVEANDVLTARAFRLAAILRESIASYPFSAPLVGEREPIYVARVVNPVLAETVKKLEIKDLLSSGEGLSPAPFSFMLGSELRPDFAVTSYKKRLFALEVKYLDGGMASQAVATALGQCLIYESSGFIATSVLFLVRTRAPRIADMLNAERKFCSETGPRLHFRVVQGNSTKPCPIWTSGRERSR